MVLKRCPHRRRTDGRHVPEKVPNTISHQGMHTKATVRHQSAPTGTARIKTRESQALVRKRRPWSPWAPLAAMSHGAAAVKTVRRFLKKRHLELACDPAIPLLGAHLKELGVGTGRVTCSPMFTAALLTIPKTWEPLTCPGTDE